MGLFVASYDISDDLRRSRVARILLGYGTRIQLSVFEIHVEEFELPDVQFEIASHLQHSDSFVLYPVDQRPGKALLSWQRTVSTLEPLITL